MPHSGNRHLTESVPVGADLIGNAEISTRMLTVDEVASYLGLSRQRVYALTSTRGIPFHKIGRSVRFNPPDIDKWLEGQRFPALDRK